MSPRVVLEVRCPAARRLRARRRPRLDVERNAGGGAAGYAVTVRDAAHRRRVEELRARWELFVRTTAAASRVTCPASGLLEAANPAWARSTEGWRPAYRHGTRRAPHRRRGALLAGLAGALARRGGRLRVRARAAGRGAASRRP